MNLLNILNRFISPVDTSGTPLDYTREKIIRLSFILAAIVCLILTVVRLFEYNGDKSMLIAVIIAFFFSIGFAIICYRGYSQFAILIANTLYILIASFEGYRLDMPMQTYIYFSLIPAISLFLIKNKTVRISYVSANILILVGLTIVTQSDTPSNLFTYILMSLICYIVLFVFVELMEKQENEIILAIDEKTEALQLLENKHEDLQLFNNMMNHDIKAPLRSIKGFSQLLRRTKPTETQKEYLDFISTSANNLEHLISDLMVYTKMNSVELESKDIDLKFIINSIFLSLKYDIEQKNVKITMEGLPNSIYGNEDGIRTIFQNLISNAIKYQPKDIENHIPTITIRHQKEEQFDVIDVEDNGIGIKKDNLEHLFTPFKRFHSAAEYQGTGLGLSICKKIIEKHNGEIELVAKESRGTCFRLRFPKK